MNKNEQMSIDLGIQEEYKTELLIYHINDLKVTKEIFIKELSYAIYNNSEIDNFRDAINYYLMNINQNKEPLCLGDKKFFSYIPDIIKEIQDHPLKTYEVSYQIQVTPLLKGMFKSNNWRNVSEIVEAHRFTEAKDIVRKRADEQQKKIKNLRVVEKKIKTDENV